ncbi:MAG TPA: hypothetical protein VFQ60_03125, partial [Patescibacteria group bacterium]|nr:hypothetical protein [Patescibacteria group bacterium]
MIILFFRLLSWITGILAIAAAITQWREPLLYPWPLVAFLVWYLLALSLLCFRRLSLRDALEKILPSVFVLISISLSFLLAEGAWEKWIVTGLFALIPFLVLELLFLLTFAPARYPVNGLSHVNVAFVPLGAFFLALAFDGLAVFLRIAPWMTLVAFMLFTAAAFYLTSHPTADHYHRRRWALLGGFVGLHV